MHLTRLEQDSGGLFVRRILWNPIDVFRDEPAKDVVWLHRDAVLAQAAQELFEGVGVAGVAEALEGVGEVIVVVEISFAVLPIGPDVLNVAGVVLRIQRLVADLENNHAYQNQMT